MQSYYVLYGGHGAVSVNSAYDYYVDGKQGKTRVNIVFGAPGSPDNDFGENGNINQVGYVLVKNTGRYATEINFRN